MTNYRTKIKFAVAFLYKMLYNDVAMDTKTISRLILHRILAVNTIHRYETKRITRNNRSTYALAMKMEGLTNYYAGGKTYVADPHQLLLISKDARYQWQLIQPGKCIMIEFEGELEGEPFDFFEFPLSDAVSREIATMLLNVANLWDLKKENYLLKCKSIFYRILDKATYSEHRETYLPSSYRHMLEPVVDYIHTRYYDKHITNESLAAMAGISTVYFRKIFTRVWGEPPIQYLRAVRIKKAKELLIGDDDSISRIAEMTGYSSVYTFSKMFKAETGVSPTEYAKEYCRNHR